MKFVVLAVILLTACILNEVAHHYFPNEDCTQIGEYTCI